MGGYQQQQHIRCPKGDLSKTGFGSDFGSRVFICNCIIYKVYQFSSANVLIIFKHANILSKKCV